MEFCLTWDVYMISVSIKIILSKASYYCLTVNFRNYNLADMLSDMNQNLNWISTSKSNIIIVLT